MARPRRQHQADDAAKAASDAARVLQQRSQAARQEEPVERVPEAPKETQSEDYVPPKRHSEQRTAMLEEIASSRKAKEVPTEPVEEPKPEVKPEPEKPAEAVETPPEAPVVDVPETPAEPEMVKVKVDGEEFEVSKAEVDEAGGVRAYQIQRAAENRLKKTNDVLAEIRKAQAEWMELQKQAKPKEPEITDDQFIASKMDTVRFGTPEEAAKAWQEIMSRQVKPLDQNAIVEQAVNRFRHDQAVQQFDQEFQDIVTKPLLLKLVVSLRNERIAQQKGPVDWTQFYRAIGNEVRSIVGKPTSTTTVQSTTSGTPSQQSDKEARKASAAVVVPTASARAAPPQEEKPETRADVIREMKRKRGLPVD